MAMNFSDDYVVESLLQSTVAKPRSLRWREANSQQAGGIRYATSVGAVQIDLSDIHLVSGVHLCLTLSLGEERIYVHEPEPSGWWGRRHRSEGDARIAGLMQRLHAAVVRQCRERERLATADLNAVRERIFGELFFRAGALPGRS